MGYKLGIGFLLFGILLINSPSETIFYFIFFLARLLFGAIGLILIIVDYVRERKTNISNKSPDQYDQNNAFVQYNMNERR